MQKFDAVTAAAIEEVERLAYDALASPDEEYRSREYRTYLEEGFRLSVDDAIYAGLRAFIHKELDEDEIHVPEGPFDCVHTASIVFGAVFYEETDQIHQHGGRKLIDAAEMPEGAEHNTEAEKELLISLRGVAEAINLPIGITSYKAKGRRPVKAMERFAENAQILLDFGSVSVRKLAERGDLVVISNRTYGALVHDDSMRLKQPGLELVLDDGEIVHEYVDDPVHGKEIRTYFSDPALRYAGLESFQNYGDGVVFWNNGEYLERQEFERSMGAFAVSAEQLMPFIAELRA